MMRQAFPCARKGSVIRVGSDCSGLESVVTALGQMGLGNRVCLEFVGDKDPNCRSFLTAAHKHTKVYSNVLDRDVEAALGAAFAAFDARAVGDAKAGKRDELREKTSDFRRDRDAANDRASHAACDELLNALYMDVVWADLAKIAATVERGESEVGASDIDLTANLEQTWTELRRRYNAAAVGPAKARSALDFVAAKWPASAHELVRRLEQRHESAVREEHDRLVGVKAQLAELEGTMAARGRMLEDCQNTLISVQFEKARHEARVDAAEKRLKDCLLYTSPSPRDKRQSRMPSSA